MLIASKSSAIKRQLQLHKRLPQPQVGARSPEQVEESPAVVETAPEPDQVEEVAAEAKPKVKRPRKKKVAAEVANENIDTPHSEAAE